MLGRRGAGSAGAFALVCACLLLCASSASAAPPPNDDFAEREVLSGSLPIEVSRSNVEATKESGESLGWLSAAGDSVWFEWEATSDGWVTVGACESSFANVAGVFTGTSVDALTRVAGENASEGPNCPFEQREYTFMAASGTEYKFVVDGNPFRMPWAPPAVTEGTFKLRVEATPAPANDDFADATGIVTRLEEEFEGEAFHYGSSFGHNWGATDEGGEPDHPGGPSGASVWYSWTAPVSGEARIGTCCGSGLRTSIYTGGSLGSLQLHFGGSGPETFMVTGGTTYRIAVYGLLDASSGEPEMAGFLARIALFAPVPVAPSGGQALPPPLFDTTPPNTIVRKRVLKRMPPIVSIGFTSSEPGSTFRCKLDKRRFRDCRSPQRFTGLEPGRHLLRVVAVDAAGNADPTPAVVRFSFPGQKKRKG